MIKSIASGSFIAALGIAVGLLAGSATAPKITYSEIRIDGPALTNGGVESRGLDLLDPSAMCWEKGKGLLVIGPPYRIEVVKLPLNKTDSQSVTWTDGSSINVQKLEPR